MIRTTRKLFSWLYMGFWISPDVFPEQSCLCSIFICEPIGYAGADRNPIGVRKNIEAYAHRSARRHSIFGKIWGAYEAGSCPEKFCIWGIRPEKRPVALVRGPAKMHKYARFHAYLYSRPQGAGVIPPALPCMPWWGFANTRSSVRFRTASASAGFSAGFPIR